MTEPQKMYNSKIEIDDLIDDAVKNVVVRRHKALDSEETLLSMSDEEAKNVSGGIKIPTAFCKCMSYSPTRPSPW